MVTTTGSTVDFGDYYKQYNTLTASNCVSGYTYTYYPYQMKDKGAAALSILKAMKAKKLLKVDSIDDFIEAMDIILKEM